MKTRIFLFTAILALVGATQAHAAERPFYHRVPIGRGVASAEVDGFQPRAGAPGTRVEIWGHGFQPGDRITLYGQTVPMRTLSPRRIVVTIPPRATTGRLMLVRAGDTIERTSEPFTVLPPAPFIASMTPEAGPPGARVRIMGKHLGPDTQLYYGEQPMPVVWRGRYALEAVIPPNARESHYLYITGPGGEARSPVRFRLELMTAPVVYRISPATGAPGEELMIQGDGFGPELEVFIGRHQATIERWSERQLVVRVPDAAGSGRQVVRVRDRHSEVTAPGPFHVLRPPALLGLSRGRVWAGSTVVLNGRDLHRGMQVQWGPYTLPIIDTDRHGRSLTVAIPDHIAGAYPVHLDDGNVRIVSPHVLEVELRHECPDQRHDDHRHDDRTHQGHTHRRDHRVMD